VKILIDTGCWLWSLTAPERLNRKAARVLSDRAHTVYLSAASTWEIVIKVALGKLHLPEPPGKYIPSRMAALDVLSLPVEHSHALRVFHLPPHHRDPFDRILIAQAQTESLILLTADRSFAAYDVDILWAARSG
jgi:PIN domain nuclease of toxin-antitoxin system